jgi:hypothetical protein
MVSANAYGHGAAVARAAVRRAGWRGQRMKV